MTPIEFIGPAIIIGTVLFGIVSIIKALSQHFLRKKIVDKNQLEESTIRALRLEESRHTALKWGMVVFFGGIGLIILEFIPYEYNSPLPFGIEAVMISAGFLLYYYLVKKEKNED
jgi:hypothetical protein